MDFKKTIPGYPCHKYIVRGLKTEQDVWDYAKAFFDITLQNNSYNYENSLNMLIASLSTMENRINVPDFRSYGQNPEAVYFFIKGNPKISTYNGCLAFYRKYDMRTQACRICPISDRCQNSNEEMEYAVLKYAFETQDNYNLVTSYIDDTFFKSCFDCAMEIPVPKAEIVNLTGLLFKSSLTPIIKGILFSGGKEAILEDKTAFDIAWEDMFCTFPKKKKVQADLKNNVKWAAVLKECIRANIEDAKTLPTDKIEEYLQNYVDEKRAEEEEKKKQKFVNPDILEFATEALKELTTAPPSHLSQEDEKYYELPDTSITPSINSNDVSISSDGTSEATEDNVEIVPLEETPKHKVQPVVVSDDIKNLFGTDSFELPIVTEDIFKDATTLVTNIPEKVLDGIMKDMMFPLEVVTIDKNTYYFAIWDRHTKCFYYSNVLQICDDLKTLLSNKNIKKICMSPYLIYGVCSLNNHTLRGLNSISTMHNMLTNKNLSYDEIVDAYSLRYDYDDTLAPEIITPLFKGMLRYRAIFTLIKEDIDKSVSPYELHFRNNLDETVGRSFLHKRTFETDGLLLTKEENSYVFCKDLDRNPTCSGAYITYLADNSEDALGMFKYILSILSEKGYSRKYVIQLLQVSSSYMELFLPSDDIEFLVTTIDILIYEYTKLNNVSYHITCNKAAS